MLTSLRLRNFKNFADETLRLGPFTVIVGANASGKSNIRDALRFLHGVGRGYTLVDVLGGKYGAGGQVEWEEIRGAPAEVIRYGQNEMRVDVDMVDRQTPDHASLPSSVSYSIGIQPSEASSGTFRVLREVLRSYEMLDWGEMGHHQSFTPIYTSAPGYPDPVEDQDDELHLLLRMAKGGSQRKYGHRVAVRPDQPALTQIEVHGPVLRAHKDRARDVAASLADMRFLEPSPRQMRQPAFPGQVVLGDSGENLPTVLQAICDDPDRRKTLLEWTRELTPMDVADLEFRTETSGKIQLAIKETDGRVTSSQCVSDGTLRFLGILAALLGEGPRVCVFEEIDSGIHPSRLHLLVELIESETQGGDLQVVTTTHAPDLLTAVSDETFETTSVVCRNPGTSDAIIRPAKDLPNVEELRRSQGLGKLHATGWMEDILYFSQSDEPEASS